MKIGLIGAGRLGICLALLIEKAGYEVLASDNREDYVKNLQIQNFLMFIQKDSQKNMIM